MRKLTEEEKNEICMCGDDKCRYSPLKHFERCPRCFSEGWHKKVPQKKKGEKKNA